MPHEDPTIDTDIDAAAEPAAQDDGARLRINPRTLTRDGICWLIDATGQLERVSPRFVIVVQAMLVAMYHDVQDEDGDIPREPTLPALNMVHWENAHIGRALVASSILARAAAGADHRASVAEFAFELHDAVCAWARARLTAAPTSRNRHNESDNDSTL